mmetsp:Transcript_13214/g.31527  ORF Transcript_13214/g.31527 Transcript_13214/m.31527 type:complete len:109 (+) Transcript_13214:3-329(+)
MVSEHFGISLIEFLAAGLVVIAHNSGGPRDDILNPSLNDGRQIGFLCDSPAEFAECMRAAILRFDDPEMVAMRADAQRSLSRFLDNERFGQECCRQLGLLRCSSLSDT